MDMDPCRDDSPATAGAELVVAGESLVDVFETGGATVVRPGGSPLNVAVGLARLGLRTRFVTEIGQDPDGDAVLAHLVASGVLLDGVRTVPRTSRAVAVLDDDGAARYEFELSWTPPPLPPPSGAILHTGSIGAWLEPGASGVLAMLHGRGSDTLASVDANIRPALVGERSAALSRIDALFAACDIVKLSDEDAEWLYPGAGETEIIDRMLGTGAGLAVLTQGSRGAVLASPRSRVHVAARPARVVDTIGAGDSFASGMLAHLAATGAATEVRAGRLDEDALRAVGAFAARCAAITVARPGADPPTAAEVGGLP